ncbi:MAG: branched-chain amino acid ABC transporter permease [Candidatus Eremiobacteraeota bacterium]|nr:branched-chain amino acid ABC transporter permease [Candidatus Eremiobacteraeota bacterium]
MLIQLLANGIAMGAVYALLGTGFSLIYYTGRIFHIAYAAIFLVAGYLLYGSIQSGISPVFAVFLSITGGTLLGVIISGCIIPLKNRAAGREVLFVVSLAMYIVLINVITLLFGKETLMPNLGGLPSLELSFVRLTSMQWMEIVFFLITYPILFYFLRTSTGLKIRALADRPRLLPVLGFSREKVFLLASGIAGFLAAGVGCLTAADVGVETYSGFFIFTIAATAAIAGGRMNITGAALVGMFLGIFQNLLAPFISFGWQEAILYPVLVMILAVKSEEILAPAHSRPEEL